MAVGLPDSGSRRRWPYLARFGLIQAVIIPYGGRSLRRLIWPPDSAAFLVFAAVGNGRCIHEGRPPRRIRRADTKSAAAFASFFYRPSALPSRGARWYSYGGRYFSNLQARLIYRYLFKFAPPESFRRAAFGFGFAFLIHSGGAAVGRWLRVGRWLFLIHSGRRLRPFETGRRKKNYILTL